MDSKGDAFKFCLNSPNAVIIIVWPSGGKACVEMAKEYVQACGAVMRYYTLVELAKCAAVPLVRAVYHGEEWLEFGSKWKKEVCFKNSGKNNDPEKYSLHVLVADAKSTTSLWRTKHSIREEMARKTGNPGDSCMHITDSQVNELSKARCPSSGSSCDSSFAFHCARVLFDDNSLLFLNTVCENEEKVDKYWDKYTDWLSHSASNPLKFPSEILEPF